MKIGLVGGSYQEFSLPFNAERSVNLYPVLDKTGKEVAALYGAPGKILFGTAGVGACRASFFSQNGRAFIVSGSTLYEVDNAGTATIRGSLNQSSGNVSIDENPTQLAICDGITVYIFTYSSNLLAQVTSINLPTSGTICFIDGYFVVNKVDTGAFYISGLNDGTSWAALDFATAESSPDSLLRVYNALGQLWLLGSTTSEIWSNTGNSQFPFQRISGAKLEVGILAPYTTVAVNSSIIWLGKDNFGLGSVYQATSTVPRKISTQAIDLIIQRATNQEDIVAYSYQEQGHVFYVLTGGGLETSLVYDFETKFWHERAYLNPEGQFEQDRGYCYMFAFNKHILGDRVNGKLYEMSMDYYSDAGEDILRERIYTHLVDEGKRIRYNTLEIGFETGVGLANGQGSNPLVSLRLSKDGARTWSTSYTTSIGRMGAYLTEVSFRRLGVARQMTFRINISDQVKVAICGSYLS